MTGIIIGGGHANHCLNQQKSARKRWEVCVGPWLPEPVRTSETETLETTVARRDLLSCVKAWALIIRKWLNCSAIGMGQPIPHLARARERRSCAVSADRGCHDRRRRWRKSNGVPASSTDAQSSGSSPARWIPGQRDLFIIGRMAFDHSSYRSDRNT
ncbi:hypothetical protein SAMN05518846_101105 [Brevibacillus centrosporus]|uniref:Uncharacterized protein n=1 Tax=Brevibacillus centrosporus TaxID=54910 RepID=A0A1I3KVG9_9BACL|nr:hypothetical protein SAMN05518846_101105 [Brevibacillus centrosporus]